MTGQVMTGQRGRRAFLSAIAAALLLAAGGFVGASFVKSPAQVAAQTGPPPAGVLTAPVVRQVVRSQVTLRGTVRATGKISVTPASEQGADALVITSLQVRPGDNVRPGQVLLAVSGRPLFVLPGAFPAYRDMEPGETGPDVAELQSALASLGYPTGDDKSGTFGAGTELAVREFYRAIGYPVPTITVASQRPGKASPAAVPIVPMAEVAFLPRFPAAVIAVSGHVGSTVSAPLVTLAAGRLGVTGQLDPSERGLVRPGMAVKLSDSVTGWSGTGSVTRLGGVSSPANGIPYVPVYIRVRHRVPLSELQANIELQIVSASTGGPVLAVPEPAISVSPGGQTFVTVRARDDRISQVRVIAGVSGGGMVAVRADGGELAAGDEVVIGR